MVGAMYTHDKEASWYEYILVSELNHVVALMETTTQQIFWVTRNTLQKDYTKKKEKQDVIKL